MTRDLFGLLRPRINERVLEVVHKHLTDEQIGLLLVKLINPYVVLSQQEEAKLRGIDRKTLRSMKARGEIPATPVNDESRPMFPKSGSSGSNSPHRGKTR